jgi:hypothetical protein
MAELKPVKLHWEMIEKFKVFSTANLVVKDGEEEIGYYRIFDDPETDNIAYYGLINKEDRRGILPPKEYKAQPNNRKMVRLIEKDLEEHGYYIPDGHKMLTDYMLVGKEKLPQTWDVLY